jgi:hypothetical protein
MSDYFFWDKKTLNDFNELEINSSFENGFLFTREHKGSMYQTRTLRINIKDFELSSENRRIINKTNDMKLIPISLPIEKSNYNWKIHKLGKDFYTNKLHLEKSFSANKIKELVPEGKTKRVTEENKIDYIKLLCHMKMTKNTSDVKYTHN